MSGYEFCKEVKWRLSVGSLITKDFDDLDSLWAYAKRKAVILPIIAIKKINLRLIDDRHTDQIENVA